MKVLLFSVSLVPVECGTSSCIDSDGAGLIFMEPKFTNATTVRLMSFNEFHFKLKVNVNIMFSF